MWLSGLSGFDKPQFVLYRIDSMNCWVGWSVKLIRGHKCGCTSSSGNSVSSCTITSDVRDKFWVFMVSSKNKRNKLVDRDGNELLGQNDDQCQ